MKAKVISMVCLDSRVVRDSVSQALITLRVVCQAIAIQAKQASRSKSELVGLFIEHCIGGSKGEGKNCKHGQSREVSH